MQSSAGVSSLVHREGFMRLPVAALSQDGTVGVAHRLQHKRDATRGQILY